MKYFIRIVRQNVPRSFTLKNFNCDLMYEKSDNFTYLFNFGAQRVGDI